MNPNVPVLWYDNTPVPGSLHRAILVLNASTIPTEPSLIQLHLDEHASLELNKTLQSTNGHYLIPHSFPVSGRMYHPTSIVQEDWVEISERERSIDDCRHYCMSTPPRALVPRMIYAAE